ncbi:MAG: carboxypeptidase regulatory-like domain-containing protein [Ignavibacteriae bacterium]|nr:carboxypeptidase regulatory-like domain-containing protein [Ignavibacteriota bacterium]
MKTFLYLFLFFALAVASLQANQVTIRVVDQNGVEIPGSTVYIQAVDAWFYNGNVATLSSGNYSVKIYPGVNSHEQNALGRIQELVVDANTSEASFEWQTVSTTCYVRDQAGEVIPGSGFDAGANYQWMNSGSPIVLPISDESVYPTMLGSWVNGFPFWIRPAINGVMLHQYQLGRSEEHIEIATGMGPLNFEWQTVSTTAFVRDQYGSIIPGSGFDATGYYGGYEWITSGTEVTLPITDELIYPTMGGSFINGLTFWVRPAINGIILHQYQLGRTEEHIEISFGMGPINFEWQMVSTTAFVSNQHGEVIPGSGFDVTGIYGGYEWIPSGDPVVVPSTDESIYPTMSGSFIHGLKFWIRPAIDGAMLHQYDLGRTEENVEITVNMQPINFEWMYMRCPLSLVNENESDIGCSFIRVLGVYNYGLFLKDEVFALPVTDESLYPTIAGNFINGITLELNPGGINEGTATFEVTSSLEFSPSFVTLGGNQYGLRCGVPDPHLLTDPSTFGSDAVLIDFEGFPNGTQITNQYESMGVSFALTSGGGPSIITTTRPRQFDPQGFACLSNNNPTAPLPRPDLVLNFSTQVNKLGFEIFTNTGDDLRLKLMLSNDGTIIYEQCFVTNLNFRFIGVTGYTFDKVIVDATETVNGVLRLDNLRFESTCTNGTSAIEGTVSSNCSTQNQDLLGVPVDVFDVATGALSASTTTNANGYYSFDEMNAGEYLVSVHTPLGYSTLSSEIPVSLPCGDEATVNFELSCSNASGSPRGIGFWKHQFAVATGEKGAAQIDGATLCNSLDIIQEHFNEHPLNAVVVYAPPSSSGCTDKLLAGKSVMNLKGSVSKISQARQHLFAFLLNVASGFIHQASVISADGATVAQAITYCDNLIDNSGGNYEIAKNIAETINEGGTVAAGIIPLSTPDVRYKTGVEELKPLPTQFILEQNYPNPFNPSTVINYQLPMESRVTLQVYDVLGKEVATLVEGVQAGGFRSVEFHSDGLPSGLYFYKLLATPLHGEAEPFSQIRKLTLTK